LSYNTEVKDLEREFGRFGPIERVCLKLLDDWYMANMKQIRIVNNPYVEDDAPKKKKQRGYAFIVFERESDMKG
jgi:U1 small nuclear ribonucleoprotein